MKIYKNKPVKYIFSTSLLLIIAIYFIENISNNTGFIDSQNKVSQNNKKSVEWFIEDFTLTSYDKSGELSHTLTANNAYKFQENNFIQLLNPYLKHFPNQNYNNSNNIKANNAYIHNKENIIKKNNKKHLSNIDVENIFFEDDVFIQTPEIIAKSNSLSYNIEKQFMQLKNNVETIYSKKP